MGRQVSGARRSLPYPHLFVSYFLWPPFDFAQGRPKKVSKERRLLAYRSAAKRELYAVILQLYLATWRLFSPAGGLLLGFLLSYQMKLSIVLYQACLRAKS